MPRFPRPRRPQSCCSFKGCCSWCGRVLYYIPWIALIISIVAFGLMAAWTVKVDNAGHYTEDMFNEIGADAGAVLSVTQAYQRALGVTDTYVGVILIVGLVLGVCRGYLANWRDKAWKSTMSNDHITQPPIRAAYIGYRVFMALLIFFFWLGCIWLTAVVALLIVWAVAAKAIEEVANAGGKLIQQMITIGNTVQPQLASLASQAIATNQSVVSLLTQYPGYQALVPVQQQQVQAAVERWVNATEEATANGTLSACPKSLCLDLSGLSGTIDLNNYCICNPQVIYDVQTGAKQVFNALIPAIVLLYLAYIAVLLLLIKYVRDLKGATKDGHWFKRVKQLTALRALDDKMSDAAVHVAPDSAAAAKHDFNGLPPAGGGGAAATADQQPPGVPPVAGDNTGNKLYPAVV